MPSSRIPPETSAETTDITSLPDRAPHNPPYYYKVAIRLLKPMYRLQVWRRSHQRANYQQEVAQRFGKQYPPRPVVNTASFDETSRAPKNEKCFIWCHSVSLGETNTVAPLLDALFKGGYQIWLTNTTQTGFSRGASRFADEIAQGQMSHSYVPVDSPRVIETFLTHVQPIAALFVETELWANILTKLSEHSIPSILVNGRLSDSSFRSYKKIGAVSSSMMKNLSLIIAQDKDSAKRFRQLGASSNRIRVAGSLKWVINTMKTDASPDIDETEVISQAETSDVKDDSSTIQQSILSSQKLELAEAFAVVDRPIWVAASTHSGEEETVLSLHQQLLSHAELANALLIIVPRHPERFDEVAALMQKSALKTARRSADEAIGLETQVYLADSMGELMTWYKLADVALVGGSLVDIGGHNPVEPASVATPIIMGHYTQSCQSVVDKLSEVGALYQPHSSLYCPVTADEDVTDFEYVDAKINSDSD